MKNSNRFCKNKNLLSLISSCKKNLRNSIIKNCSKEEIYSIIECILNVYNGNVKIPQDLINKLRPYKKTFEKLLDRNSSLDKKRQLIIQKGGFLQILIPAITSAIASVISEIAFKK